MILLYKDLVPDDAEINLYVVFSLVIKLTLPWLICFFIEKKRVWELWL